MLLQEERKAIKYFDSPWILEETSNISSKNKTFNTSPEIK